MRPASVAPDIRRPHRARKRFGQHFLEHNWVVKVMKALAPRADEVYVEIGPGPGALTLPLIRVARHVVAFEIDHELAVALRDAGHPNLSVVEGDVLEVSLPQIRDLLRDMKLDTAPLRLAGNLPYNVASPILFKVIELYEGGLPLLDAVVMLQREVADRLLAVPGTGDYSALSVLVRHVADVDRMLALPPGAFRPPPEVHSSLVRLRLHAPAPMPRDLALFRTIVRSVFTRRRKTLVNALGALPRPLPRRAAELLDAAGIDGQRRPETLEIPEFVRLADAITSAGGR